jgi:3-oxoacyl-[acyl-carrier-protein] synthase II
MLKRVVVTGIGAVTPYGQHADFFDCLVAGQSAIGELTAVTGASRCYCHVVGEVRDFNPLDFIASKSASRMDRFIQLAVVASDRARQDAGLTGAFARPERVGVVIGSAAGGFETIETNFERMAKRGPDKCSPFTVPMLIVNMASGWVSILQGAEGYSSCVSTACATGSSSIGEAMRTIQLGQADLMFAGGTDAPITPLCMAGFASSRVLTQRNDAPAAASRPFDNDRDGFIMSEGACVLILEEFEHATARGARIYAELVGFGCVSDAYDITTPRADGEGARRAMAQALEQAGWQPESLDYINAHATSTLLGDRSEANAIRALLGENYMNVPVSATKSMTGHMLGAAGAIEAAICCLAISESKIPPTINLASVDPLCQLNHVQDNYLAGSVDRALSNSFGFGSHNTALAFQKLN